MLAIRAEVTHERLGLKTITENAIALAENTGACILFKFNDVELSVNPHSALVDIQDEYVAALERKLLTSVK